MGQRLRELSEGQAVGGLHVYQALLESDPGAVSLVRTAADYLAQAMGTIVAVLDPQVFVIGGGLSEAGDLILDPIREALSSQLPAKGYRPEPKIVAAKFTNQAGVIGAADLARESVG